VKLYVDFQYREAVATWGLPGDLYNRQAQLKDLHIAVPITNIDWLHAKLRSLEGHQQLASIGLGATIVARKAFFAS
jgi:hypothetical protein